MWINRRHLIEPVDVRILKSLELLSFEFFCTVVVVVVVSEFASKMNRAKTSPRTLATPKLTPVAARKATPSARTPAASARKSIAATPKNIASVHPLEKNTATPKPKKRVVEEVSSDDEVYGVGEVASEESEAGEQIYVEDFEKDPNIQLMLVTIPPGVSWILMISSIHGPSNIWRKTWSVL